MKKLIKWLLGIVAFLAVLIVLAIVLLPIFFDPNEHKPRIQEIAAENLGREVVLNGPIEWSVFPWVAINLNDVSIANEAGFKGDHLAQVEQVAVRVKLLPLLKKQIQVGQVELQKPNINLQVAKSGKSNWQSIIDHMDQGSAGSAPSEGSSTDLEIRGISISDGTMSYADGGADLRIQMNDLSFESEAIKAGSPTKMSFDSQIEIAAQELKGQLKTAWLAEGLTSDSGMSLDFSSLDFEGLSAGMPLQLTTSGKTVLNLAEDSLMVDNLTLNYGALSLNTPLQGKQITKNMALSGQLNIDEFSLAELLAELGSPLDNQANNDLSGQMQWSLVGDRLQLKNVDMKLDESSIKGDLDLRQMSQLKGQFNLSINELDLDKYLPAEQAGNEAASSETSVAMDLGQMTGAVKMTGLVASGVNLSDITLKIKTNGKNITIEPLQADFYQGLIKTEVQFRPESRTQKVKLTHSMKDFQAGSLLTDLMGTDYLTGLGQLNADINIDEPFAESPLKTTNGSISYKLTDGDIVGIDVFQIMQQSLSLLNKTDAVKSNSELKTEFGLMEIQADINQGVLKTNTLKLNSPYFDMKGDVEIDLDQQTIKGSIQPMLTNIPEGVLDKNFEKLINLRIPVTLKGSLLEPEISIDIAKLILATQKEKIDQKKEELKDELLGKLLGSQKDKNEAGADNNTGSPDESGQGEAEPEMTAKQKKRAKKDKLKKDLLQGLFKSKKDSKDDDTESDDGGE